jgi:large subunit ribosomal protein L22
MKTFKASGKFLRVSSRKMLMSIPNMKGAKAADVQSVLQNLPTKSARLALKILNSAIANAKSKDANVDQLYLKNIIINQGTRYKRIKIKARGSADVIKKPTSHILIEIEEKKPKKQVLKKKKTKKEV